MTKRRPIIQRIHRRPLAMTALQRERAAALETIMGPVIAAPEASRVAIAERMARTALAVLARVAGPEAVAMLCATCHGAYARKAQGRGV